MQLNFSGKVAPSGSVFNSILNVAKNFLLVLSSSINDSIYPFLIIMVDLWSILHIFYLIAKVSLVFPKPSKISLLISSNAMTSVLSVSLSMIAIFFDYSSVPKR